MRTNLTSKPNIISNTTRGEKAVKEMTAAYWTAGCLLPFYPATPHCYAAKVTQAFSSHVSFTEPGRGDGDSQPLGFYTRSKAVDRSLPAEGQRSPLAFELWASSDNVHAEKAAIGCIARTCSALKALSWWLISSALRWRCHVKYLTAAQQAATPPPAMWMWLCAHTHVCVCMTAEYLKTGDNYRVKICVPESSFGPCGPDGDEIMFSV